MMSTEEIVRCFWVFAGKLCASWGRLIFAAIYILVTEILFRRGYNFAPRRIQSGGPSYAIIRHELVHALMTLSFGGIIEYTLKSLISAGYIFLLPLQHYINPWMTLARIVVEIAVYFVLFDAYFYFLHRYLHINKFLYRTIHRVHHESSTPNAVAGFSFNPVEGTVFGMFLPAYCCGVTQIFGGICFVTLVSCGMLQLLQTILIHGGYEYVDAAFFEGPRAVFLTPTFHDRHHEHPNCNFSGFFTWLDDLLGTADTNWRCNYASWQRQGRSANKNRVKHA